MGGASGCICDKGEYENHETATCEKVMEGVREDKAGMNRHFTFQLGSEEKGLEKALEERAKIEEKHPEVLRLAFLYRNYEPMSYNFEVFETSWRPPSWW
ncbi:hypothetical protein TrVE_jg427 [Triparma verrucosa]|uniref:Uncharacterized protein n=1 Tax=Triparma verrucosa TaxID=1606542 RepID=A0A9W7ET05_9STRA|nr:hypothetical protein TrVE_jg427 [Triparma verrucosa]